MLSFLVIIFFTEKRCGFEDDDICGWNINTTGNVSWHVHTGADNDVIGRTKGTHFDHTYGASKHVGMSSFMSRLYVKLSVLRTCVNLFQSNTCLQNIVAVFIFILPL